MSSTTKSRRSSRGAGKAGSSRASRDFSAEADSMIADEVDSQAQDVAAAVVDENNSGIQAPHTPAAGANSSSRRSSMYEDTPTRVQRLHEKEELHDLNKRLELYILKQRERDAYADGWVRESKL